ncbi:MAG TPA: prepilin peptidase [Candidatus Baltobacteraceae bacterium]|jgi:prepilin peptidase CpaA|nr:prepilin peptidase [Candidatus Baltobacteraceae bacterium]
MTLAIVLVLAASVLAAGTDVRTRRIPNALVVALFVSGLALNAVAGWQPAALDVAIVIAVLAAGTFAFSLKLIGGGDVKLLAVAAGTLGVPAAGTFILATLLSGGVIAIIYSALRGRLRTTLHNVKGLALPVFAGAAPPRLLTGTQMPYALAIFAGASFTAFAGGIGPHLRFLW